MLAIRRKLPCCLCGAWYDKWWPVSPTATARTVTAATGSKKRLNVPKNRTGGRWRAVRRQRTRELQELHPAQRPHHRPPPQQQPRHQDLQVRDEDSDDDPGDMFSHFSALLDGAEASRETEDTDDEEDENDPLVARNRRERRDSVTDTMIKGAHC